MAVYVVYKTDEWHSYESRNIIGIATSPMQAKILVLEQAKKENVKISRGEIEFLEERMQTQNYAGEGQFQFEKMETNKLL